MRHFKNHYFEDLNKNKNPDDTKKSSDEHEGDDDKETVPELPGKMGSHFLLVNKLTGKLMLPLCYWISCSYILLYMVKQIKPKLTWKSLKL